MVTYGPGLEEGLAVGGRRLADDEVADLASAPDGCVVQVELTTDNGSKAIRLTSENPSYLRYPVVRVIRVTDDELTIENERFELFDSARRQGIGALALACQVRACLGVGVVRLDAYAAGRFGADATGYYVWPRLGFDARVPPWLWQNLGAARLANLGLDFTAPGWVSDLMATSEGERLWHSMGQGLTMSLAVEPESPAVQRFLALLVQWRL